MIITVLAVTAAVAIAVAIKKHGSLAAAEASFKKEIADFKAEFAKIEAAAKAEEVKIVADIKALIAKIK